MAENNVVFTNNTTKLLYPTGQHFWSGTPLIAPGRIPPRSTAQGKQRPTAAGALKFATVYADSEEELPTTRQFISAFDIAFPQEYGPYGSQLPRNYSMILGLDESIKEILVRHNEVIDAIGFVVADNKSGTTTTKMFGGGGGDLDKITLQSNEHITQISGKYRRYFQFPEVINRLIIHTNLNPRGYGPFGKETSQPQHNQRDFVSVRGQQVVGFFGKHDRYVESIGLFLSTGAGPGGVSKAYAESGPVGPIDWNVVEVKLGLSKPSDVYVDNILGSKVEATVSNNGDATVVISDS